MRESDGPPCCNCNYGERPCTCGCHTEAADTLAALTAERDALRELVGGLHGRIAALQAEQDICVCRPRRAALDATKDQRG